MSDAAKRVALALLAAAELDRQIAGKHESEEHAVASEVKKRMAEWVLELPSASEDLRRIAMITDSSKLFVGGTATGRLLMSIGRIEGHDSQAAFAEILHQLALVATDDEIDHTLEKLHQR